MYIKRHDNGIYYSFDKSSWKGNWKAFDEHVRKLPSFARAWEVGEPDDYWYFVGKKDLEAFNFLKNEYIDKVIKDKEECPDIPRVNHKFNRRRIV